MVVAPSQTALDKAKEYKTAHNIEYALLAGADKAIAAFGVKAVPAVFLVGKDGKVLWTGHHAADPELAKALETAMAAK